MWYEIERHHLPEVALAQMKRYGKKFPEEKEQQ